MWTCQKSVKGSSTLLKRQNLTSWIPKNIVFLRIATGIIEYRRKVMWVPSAKLEAGTRRACGARAGAPRAAHTLTLCHIIMVAVPTNLLESRRPPIPGAETHARCGSLPHAMHVHKIPLSGVLNS